MESTRIDKLCRRLTSGDVVILDGALGTELQRRGVHTELPLWSAAALRSHPDLVKAVHREYIEAGSEIITTNTFRTGVRPLAKANLPISAEELTKIACGLALQARAEAEQPSVLIAGCVATVEDCYEPQLTPPQAELEAEHSVLVRALAEGGVDFIFAETMNTVRESVAVLQAAHQVGIPAAISFVCQQDGTLFSGESLDAALREIAQFQPLFVGVNCVPPERILHSAELLLSKTKLPVAVYANGVGKPGGALGWEFGDVGSERQEYVDHALSWASRGAQIIGGCCGTTPEYIAALSRAMSAENEVRTA